MTSQMIEEVDLYLIDGCGRCPLKASPQCKVNFWPGELRLLRQLLLDCGLTEELKWSMPTYTYKGANVAMMSAFKEYASINFFKGALLADTHLLLHKPGENSQSARLLKFTSVDEIKKLEQEIKAYLFEAIEVERQGLKVDFKQKDELVLPDELIQKLEENDELRAAWEKLTPGRKRGYVLFFTAPKQAKTRESRIEKFIPKILEGKGMQE